MWFNLLWCGSGSTVASQQRGSRFESRWGLPCGDCMLSQCLRAFSRYSSVLPQSKDMHIGAGWFGDSKLTRGLNLRVNGCLSLCCPRDGLATCPEWTLPLTQRQLWLALAPPATLKRKSSIEDGWIHQNYKPLTVSTSAAHGMAPLIHIGHILAAGTSHMWTPFATLKKITLLTSAW